MVVINLGVLRELFNMRIDEEDALIVCECGGRWFVAVEKRKLCGDKEAMNVEVCGRGRSIENTMRVMNTTMTDVEFSLLVWCLYTMIIEEIVLNASGVIEVVLELIIEFL